MVVFVPQIALHVFSNVGRFLVCCSKGSLSFVSRGSRDYRIAFSGAGVPLA